MAAYRAFFRTCGGAALVAIVAASAACTRYPQDSPEAVLASAREMVRSGRADRLPGLIYADSREMREFLGKLGEVLGTLQDLAGEVQKAFPDEIAAYRQQAEEAARRGEAGNFLRRITGQAMGARAWRPGRDQADQMPSGFDMLMKEVFSDPYGWLTENEARLSVTRVNMPDDMAAVLWDNKPVMGVGLSMKQEEDGAWYVQLPLPPGVLPQSADSWEVIGDALGVVDNMLIDLKRDVQSGKARRLEDLARDAGEKAFVPAALVMLAYGKVREAEKQEQAKAAPPPADPGAPPPG